MNEMNIISRVFLSCGVCDACPAVEISPEAVTIGEDDNTVRLTHAQWNDLVTRIRAGELSNVKA
jgi:hypothetical protein